MTVISVSINIVDEAIVSDVIDDIKIHSVDEILKDSLNSVVV